MVWLSEKLDIGSEPYKPATSNRVATGPESAAYLLELTVWQVVDLSESTLVSGSETKSSMIIVLDCRSIFCWLRKEGKVEYKSTEFQVKYLT